MVQQLAKASQKIDEIIKKKKKELRKLKRDKNTQILNRGEPTSFIAKEIREVENEIKQLKKAQKRIRKRIEEKITIKGTKDSDLVKDVMGELGKFL